MIVSTQITNTGISVFIAVLVVRIIKASSFVYKQKKTIETRPTFKKIANFTGKLPQN